jgi:hypothetical protein
MQRGPDGEEELLALFADDAVYEEPFSDGAGVHRGIDAIRAHLDLSLGQAPPDLRITVDSIDIGAGVVSADWTCESPIWSKPARGRDRFEIREGRIARLETTLTDPPEPA